MALRILYIVFAVLSLINATWMLIAPESWYRDLPAGVPDTGPYNGHFIRDLGLVFVLVAVGFFYCAQRIHQSRAVLFAITAFFAGHALLHVLDLVSSRLPHSHWRTDTPAVFFPAILLILLNFVPEKFLKDS